MGIKATKGKKGTGIEKGTLLMPPPADKYKQQSIDGKKTIKETAPKEIQEAAETWLFKKREEARAKDTTKKTGEKVLKLMEKAKLTDVVVFDQDLQCKQRILILQGVERLRVSKASVND